MSEYEWIRIVFDAPPGPESGRFIEVETEHGNSISFGEWVEGEDGLWYLQFPNPANEHASLKRENKRLEEFWNRLCEYVWDGSDFDGGTHQEWGLELGLLRIEIYDPEGKHKDWNVQDVIEGDEFFVNNIIMPPDALLADTQEQLTKNR